MGKALEVTEFEADVAEYKSMETKVTQDFFRWSDEVRRDFKNVNVLNTNHKKQWTEYLEKVGRTMTAANQKYSYL